MSLVPNIALFSLTPFIVDKMENLGMLWAGACKSDLQLLCFRSCDNEVHFLGCLLLGRLSAVLNGLCFRIIFLAAE